MNSYIKPNWPAPKNIKAFTTTCLQSDLRIPANRQKLAQEFHLPAEPFWLKQEHTNIVIHLKPDTTVTEPIADAAFTTTPNLICAVLTADCVPILVCDRKGTMVAAIHAGWKGIANGIIESTIKAMATNATELIAWLGPAIGKNCFEIKDDVREIFIKHNPETQKAFTPYNNDSFLTDIYLLATQRLNSVGITTIYGGEYCTFIQKELFFSYRRDGASSGRMASIIWLAT